MGEIKYENINSWIWDICDIFYEVIRLSIKNKDGIQWSIILPTAHYKKIRGVNW